MNTGLTWSDILRLGLVQTCLGAIVVLTTSTLNRLMVVELALPAVLPGLLVALHYGIQITRPHGGFKSDRGGRRWVWILLGMMALALGGFGAALGVTLFETSFALGLSLSVLAYAAIGLGGGASGTAVLALLATATAPRRRAAAATITWLMMIAGIIPLDRRRVSRFWLALGIQTINQTGSPPESIADQIRQNMTQTKSCSRI